MRIHSRSATHNGGLQSQPLSCDRSQMRRRIYRYSNKSKISVQMRAPFSVTDEWSLAPIDNKHKIICST